MHFELSHEFQFCAAHMLPDYLGKCSNMHGHTWKILVTFQGSKDNFTHMLEDFQVIKREINRIIDKLDHSCLNEIQGLYPTAEEICLYLFDKILHECRFENNTLSLLALTIWESDKASITLRR